MLEMNGISKRWGGKAVLKNIDLRIEAGDTLGLMGPSGGGKSTLARIMLLLENPTGGNIFYCGQRMDKKNKQQMKQFRREVQYISQYPESFFDPNWKLQKSVWEAVTIHKLDKQKARERFESLLQDLQLDAAVLERYPYQVSGGEIQRAALCRALLLEPKLLVLDEATSMLDISVQAQVLTCLKQIQCKRSLTFLMISHDKEVVDWFTDRAFVLTEGELSLIG